MNVQSRGPRAYDGISSHPKAGRPETQEQLMFRFKSEGREETKNNVPAQRQSGRRKSLTCGRIRLYFLGRTSADWTRPTTPRRAVCFT